MDYTAALEYVLSLVDYEKSPRFLFSPQRFPRERMVALLKFLGHPERGRRTIHIAGTKGKGSVAAMMASVLARAGYTTGLYTSPHLHTFRERIQMDGEIISPENMARLVDMIQPAVAAVNAQASLGVVTTFEVLTALAFLYFEERGVEFQVLEVGMGGRLDATNAVPPAEVAIITSISHDHVGILGDTLEEIAVQKAGIIKEGCPVVSAPQPPEVATVIQRVCQEQKATLVQVGQDVVWHRLGGDLEGQAFVVEGEAGTYRLWIPLLGEHQLENAAVAVAAVEALRRQGLDTSPAALASGLAEVRWPGRLEVVGRQPLVVVDGAHNDYSAARLREALEQLFPHHPLTLVVGTSMDKNISGIVAELALLGGSVVTTRSRHPRAAQPQVLAQEFARHGVTATVGADVPAALAQALFDAAPQGVICVTGSLFVVAEAREVMLGLSPEELPAPAGSKQ
ncbi:MAG: bifunctional folylpolyglutamate synthase/dihydrofolate synthase [Chloroflexi bacterium]|nr:bifunctional folylpolyglutamate synthase/dihydrofolate synthase [Chloroflexota bacterium]